MLKIMRVLIVFSLLFSGLLACSAEQCGVQAGGALCPNNLCCSRWGWCGTTVEYCCNGCQSNCWPPEECPTAAATHKDDSDDIGSVICRDMFENMLKNRNPFYTYDAFITAAKSFPDFASTGNETTRKREIAAFLAQTSHETTGARPTTPDGPYAWGYRFVTQRNPPSKYCDPRYSCPKSYHGRGPIQLSWNYNYQQAGLVIGVDLINNPDLLATDAVISFKTAIWFWMTPQSPAEPSCHDLITGRSRPSRADNAAGRVAGYGVITNIINGGIECGKGPNQQVKDRIGYYVRYCKIFGVSPGNNLDCYNQGPFGSGLLLETM